MRGLKPIVIIGLAVAGFGCSDFEKPVKMGDAPAVPQSQTSEMKRGTFRNKQISGLQPNTLVTLTYNDLSYPANVQGYADINGVALLENVDEDRSYAITVDNADIIFHNTLPK